MESNRNDHRRRRVLYDEAVQRTAVSADAADSTPKRRRANNYVTRRCQQLRTSDLIPTRKLSLSLVATASLVVLGLLNGLQYLGTKITSWLEPGLQSSLSLTAANSLASWCSAIGFFCAALFGLQVYAMRRHRRDDYRGTYRIWLVLCGVFALASVQCVVPLERIAASLVAQAIRSPAFAPGEVGIVGVKLAFLAAVFVRMSIEVRRSRASGGFLVAALAMFAASVLSEVPSLGAAIQQRAAWLSGNLFLIGGLLLLNSVIAYARYVILDAQGKLIRRSRGGRLKALLRPRGKSGSSNSPRESSDATTGRGQTQPAATSQRSSTAQPAPSDSADDDDEDRDDEEWDSDSEADDREFSRLSKTERKRLKKLRRRHAA
jgi:hypothetical protein